MAQYDLIYWSVPFRGQFVRAVLAQAGKEWTETDDSAIATLMEKPVADMPVPFMGPPVLIDKASGFAVSQMPAIVFYLGETLGLLPDTAAQRALTLKLVNDANDVIDELSLNGGRDMWTEARWQQTIPRLRKWMTLWEDLGRRNGLTPTSGCILGEAAPGIADIVTATLWITLADRFNRLEAVLAETAPMTLALSRRVYALAPLAALRQKAQRDYGEAYAGGQIGQSMTAILNA